MQVQQYGTVSSFNTDKLDISKEYALKVENRLLSMGLYEGVTVCVLCRNYFKGSLLVKLSSTNSCLAIRSSEADLVVVDL